MVAIVTYSGREHMLTSSRLSRQVKPHSLGALQYKWNVIAVYGGMPHGRSIGSFDMPESRSIILWPHRDCSSPMWPSMVLHAVHSDSSV